MSALHFWCIICRAYRADAECEKCGNACALSPDWFGARGGVSPSGKEQP